MSDTRHNAPFVQVQYGGGGKNPDPIAANGKIIQGCQSIYSEFTIPSFATAITLQFSTSLGTSHFGVIRIYPVNGSAKSYIYNPLSLKSIPFAAENDYSKLHEYTQESSLTRTKKETERGIMTMSENRQSNPKK